LGKGEEEGPFRRLSLASGKDGDFWKKGHPTIYCRGGENVFVRVQARNKVNGKEKKDNDT